MPVLQGFAVTQRQPRETGQANEFLECVAAWYPVSARKCRELNMQSALVVDKAESAVASEPANMISVKVQRPPVGPQRSSTTKNLGVGDPTRKANFAERQLGLNFRILTTRF